jgi:DNA ligase-1
MIEGVSISTFPLLYCALDEAKSTSVKISLLVRFLAESPRKEAQWGLFLLSGGKVRRVITTTQLRKLAASLSDIPDWLFEESYQLVGDLAETVSLLLPNSGITVTGENALTSQSSSHFSYVYEWGMQLSHLADCPDEDRKLSEITSLLAPLSTRERLVFGKLLTGGLRIGVSKATVIKAIALHYHLDEGTVAYLLVGKNRIEDFDLSTILNAQAHGRSNSLAPYPFALAHPIPLATGRDENVGKPSWEELGTPSTWIAEWKWDGIRAQIVVRENGIAIWSRGEEVVSETFPELCELKHILPHDTVIDGEIIAFDAEQLRPAPFARLQQRLNRKKVSKNLLTTVPITFIPYDVLELRGEDLRSHATSERRRILAEMLHSGEVFNSRILQNQPLEWRTWEELEELHSSSRDIPAEGLMLKRADASYPEGRKRGNWWKWKVAPFTVDGVLVYAQKGHGRRANLYSDYTFAVWAGDTLLPFAKAYSGLTDVEMKEVHDYITKNTKERFGPVRTVIPKIVCEIAFEGLSLSTRHKSGVAVRFPRISRLRLDKKVEDADTIETLKGLLGKQLRQH